MAASTNAVALVGCTGLVGSQILAALQGVSSKPTIHAIARRELPSPSPSPPPTVKAVVEADSSKWPALFNGLTPPPKTLFSALGTTRGQAGSFEAQRAIDYDLNLSLARAAKESGVETYVLISSTGVSTGSPFLYPKMKAELEEAIKGLGFPHTVIVKPGLLVGKRSDTRLVEASLRYIAKGMGLVSKTWLTDWWAQDADVIGRAAVGAGLECTEGKKDKGVWIVDQKEIIRIGRKEFKDNL
ncbi:MAG: hypothetical protein LQ342_006748 [Letrouitia transgressa]|nr:MAG: hypothetical protein LQ342_006748 [Letrouitia transgressa]